MRRPTRAVVDFLREFIDVEVAGGLVLLAAAVVAMIWANAFGGYDALWHTHLALTLPGLTLDLDLREWINDLLMALFFFVVGLEIKREIVDGELRQPRRAALPLIAALGGMVVPAAIYLALNQTGPASRGWGVPMATDIAFAVGVLALFGRGLPVGLRVFLLSLAIADDIGAIVVIALFYSDSIRVLPLVVGATSVAAFWASWMLPRRARWIFLAAFAAAAWAGTHESGVHATIAGVALGLATPAGAAPDPSPAERLAHRLHPFSSFLIVPLFALANAGVVLPAQGLLAALTHPVSAGVMLGLVAGKVAGISLASYLAVRLRVASLPTGATWTHIVAVSAVAGIGFTVSLFIIQLAFSDPALIDAAKTGVLVASVVAAGLGWVLLKLASRRVSASRNASSA